MEPQRDLESQFVRATFGMLATQLLELTRYVGTINGLIAALDEKEIAAEARSLNKGLEELDASVARVAEAFPPPSGNGPPSH